MICERNTLNEVLKQQMASGRKHHSRTVSALQRVAFGWLLLAFAALQFSGLTVRFSPTLSSVRDRAGAVGVASLSFEQQVNKQLGRGGTEVRALGDDRDRLPAPGFPPLLGPDRSYEFGPLFRSAQGGVSAPASRTGSAAQTQARAPPRLA